MKGSYRLFKIKGITISLHITFLFLVPLLVISSAEGMGGGLISLLYSFAFIFSLFSFVLMHELSHSFMAIRNGIPVKKIILTPLGGMATIGIFDNAVKEFKISVAGPLSNFLVGTLLLIILASTYGTAAVGEAIASRNMLEVPSFFNFLVLMVYLNFVLGAFNLFLPIFPMDGGRVLRSMLNMLMDRLRATRVAMGISQAFLSLFFVLSLLAGSLWLVVISVFLFFIGMTELKMTEMAAALETMDLEKFVVRDFTILHPELRVSEFVTMIKNRQNLYPVVTETGKVKGVVLLEHLKVSNKKIEDVMERDVPTIKLTDDDSEILNTVFAHGYVIVLDKKGVLEGVLTLKNMQKAIKRGLKKI